MCYLYSRDLSQNREENQMSVLSSTSIEPVENHQMKVWIIYDSVYGNTEKIAQAIGNALTGEVKVLKVGERPITELKTVTLLIVGSPTHGGSPTPAIQNFLKNISDPALGGIKVAAFDTRMSGRLVGVFGYAADRIAESLKKKGGRS